MSVTDSLTEWALALTWLMWPWWVMTPKEDFTGVEWWYLTYLTYLVIIAKEVKIVKEVISCDIFLLCHQREQRTLVRPQCQPSCPCSAPPQVPSSPASHLVFHLLQQYTPSQLEPGSQCYKIYFKGAKVERWGRNIPGSQFSAQNLTPIWHRHHMWWMWHLGEEDDGGEEKREAVCAHFQSHHLNAATYLIYFK